MKQTEAEQVLLDAFNRVLAEAFAEDFDPDAFLDARFAWEDLLETYQETNQ